MKEAAYLGEFWTAQGPFLIQGPVEGHKQSLEHREEMYVSEDTVAGLVH